MERLEKLIEGINRISRNELLFLNASISSGFAFGLICKNRGIRS